MNLIGTNQELRNALVESDRLEIIGDLGEGVAIIGYAACMCLLRYRILINGDVLCRSIWPCVQGAVQDQPRCRGYTSGCKDYKE